MLKPLMRRSLPAFAPLALLLFAAPSALGASHSHTETMRAAHRVHSYKLHQKADTASRRKADSKSDQKADSKSSRRAHGKSHKKAASKSADTKSAVPFSAALTPATVLLGDSTAQSRQTYLSAERSAAFRFRAEAAGTTGSARIYIAPANGAGVVVVGIYSNAGDQPGALLSVGSIASPTAGAWNSVALTASSIASGQSYWLAILGEGGTLRYSVSQRGSCPSATSAQADLGGLPAIWSSGRGRLNCPISAYVTAAESILTPPVEIPPLETPPVETPPVKTPPVETPPVKTPPVETPPVKTHPVETPPVETPPVEVPPVETPTPAPTNTALPSLAGATTEGDTLTATNGAWTGSPTAYADQWQDCNTSGASCTNISGASTSTHKLTTSDVGHTLRVVVTANNEGGSTSAASVATATVVALPPPPPSAPTNTALPTIAGTTTEGQTLSATSGTWEGKPTGYTYQWQDCNTSGASCTNVSDANGSTYALTAGDVEHTVRVVVTATNDGGSTSAASAATATVVALPPPPPPAPTNTAMPAISGTAAEGQVLSTTTGAWTSDPTSYTYQWRDCNSSGHSCTNVSGATTSTYRLGTRDVSHTVRVMVTAANAGGSASMSSPATSAVTAPPPAAPTNTALPTIAGTTTEGQTLSATSGTWEGDPTGYTYQWQDCNTSGASCTNISGATTATHKLTASDVEDTIRVILTATNEGGSTPATSAATATIAADPPPPPPTAPTNTALPTIAGTTTEGQTLNATNGTWEGDPTGYTYQWQDCNTSGASCTNISGATASTRVLTSGDAGHTLRVVVKASNTAGTGEATSGATAVVAVEQTGGTPEGCFADPESCGYPGTQNTGVANCSALKASGGKTITKAETVEGLDITGEVVIDASGVKLNDDCIEVNGGEEQGSAAVILDNGANNFTISNSTVRGKNTTSQSIEEALRNNYSNAGATATKDRLENCAECLHQTWSIDESYVNANGEEKADESGLAHAEDWWFDNGTISANDDTLLNPSKQTAVIFAESGGGSCENHETVTNSLLAGGGFMFYFCAHSSGAGSSSIDIKDNRFARMVCTKKEISNFEGRGGYGCGPEGAYFSYGEGSGGYFPRGGFFGIVYEGEGIYNKGAGWEGNYWDNNLGSVEAP
jgi:hypothetical protein